MTRSLAKRLQILDMDNGDVKSGKMLLHTEHSLLSALSTHTGVIHQHGMFKVIYDLKLARQVLAVTVQIGHCRALWST